MRQPLSDCIPDEGMRICLDVIRLLEREPEMMHARDYLIAARFMRAALNERSDAALTALARNGERVLAEAAESLLFERGIDHRIDDEEQRRCAAWLTEQAMFRLRRGAPVEAVRTKRLNARTSRPRRA